MFFPFPDKLYTQNSSVHPTLKIVSRVDRSVILADTHVSSKHLNRYLAEFSYRFNPRFKQRRVTIFDRLITACCATEAITYRQLVADLSG
jgi:hypothetical protein